ncbi:SRPBCC family protein [Micrococcaceae bacterium Sec5.8]
MTRFSGTILIRRPIEEVFGFVADERNEPAYNPQMRSVAKLTPGPIGVGTRWRAVLTSGTRATPLELEVTEYAPPERLGSVTRMDSADISGVLTFALEAAGTRMTWTWDVRPKGLLKLTAPLIAALGRRQEQRIWSALKAHLETAEER